MIKINQKILISFIIVTFLIIWGGFLFTRFFEIKIYSKNSFTREKEKIVIAPGETLSQEEIKKAKAYLKFVEIKSQTIPTGIPEIYGQTLGVSFDKVQEAINKVAPFDLTYGSQKIILTGSDLERYIKIGKLTACKYCCGAKTLVFDNGEAACGCEHSQMMRGLLAYLIKNQPQLSDEKMLEELNKWRATFFPKQILQEVLAEKVRTGEEGIQELIAEFPEFLPQMVGGC